MTLNVVFGVRGAGLNISETADLRGDSCGLKSFVGGRMVYIDLT